MRKSKKALDIYHLAISTIFIFIPVLLVALYSIILIKLKKQAHPGEESANAEEQRTRRNRNVLKMAIVIVLGFFFCWTPYVINELIPLCLLTGITYSCSSDIEQLFTEVEVASIGYLPRPPLPPLQKRGCITIVSNFSLDFQKSPSSDFKSSLAVGRFAAKKGSLRSPRGRLVASLISHGYHSLHATRFAGKIL